MTLFDAANGWLTLLSGGVRASIGSAPLPNAGPGVRRLMGRNHREQAKVAPAGAQTEYIAIGSHITAQAAFVASHAVGSVAFDVARNGSVTGSPLYG